MKIEPRSIDYETDALTTTSTVSCSKRAVKKQNSTTVYQLRSKFEGRNSGRELRKRSDGVAVTELASQSYAWLRNPTPGFAILRLASIFTWRNAN